MDDRFLELTVKIHGDEFDVEVYEPETGEFTPIRNIPYSPDEHPEFDSRIGRAIYSWLDMWKDEAERNGGPTE